MRLVFGVALRIQGIDLSGDPSKGDPANFLPALARARTLGLKLAVHLAELDRPEDTDALLGARQVQPHALPNWSRGFEPCHALCRLVATLHLLKDCGVAI